MTTVHSLLRASSATSLFATALVTLLAAGNSSAQEAAATATDASPWTITKHIDLTSRYVLRGVTRTYGNAQPLGNEGADAPESDQPTLQWGADFIHSSGWSFGYWASAVNYSYKQLGQSYSDRSITQFQKPRSVENDLYFAYTGNIASDLTYTLGMTGYYYLNGKHSNALETKSGLTWGPLSFTAQTLLNDVIWGNKGDTYWTLVYTKPLPNEITFTGTLGAYTYHREGKYLGTRDTAQGTSCASGEAFVVNGCYAGNSPSSAGLRHLTLALSGPIPTTPVSWSVQAIIGGYNRFAIKQSNGLLGSLSWGF